MSIEFNYKKIHEYIRSLSHHTEEISFLGKKIERLETQSDNRIKEILQSIMVIKKKIGDNAFKKSLMFLDFIDIEKAHFAQLGIISKKIKQWKEDKDKQVEALTTQARQLDKKRQNKTLKEPQVQKFREKLYQASLAIQNSKKDMMLLVSQIRLKQNCQLVEKLTKSMQEMKKQKDPGNRSQSPNKPADSKVEKKDKSKEKNKDENKAIPQQSHKENKTKIEKKQSKKEIKQQK